MDFQTDSGLHVMGEDDGITMDVVVPHPGSGLELSVSGDIVTSEGAYLLPHTAVDLPLPGDPSDLVSQHPVFISLSHDNVVVKTEQDGGSQPAQQQVGEISLVNYSSGGGGSSSLLSRPTNSTVQLTHDGKVNIVTREPVEIPQVQLQQVVMADGTLAYLNFNPATNTDEQMSAIEKVETEMTSQNSDALQAVRLDDGSITYLTASLIPEGTIDTSALTLTDKTQVTDLGSVSEGTWSQTLDVCQPIIQLGPQLPSKLTYQPTAAAAASLRPPATSSHSTGGSMLGSKVYACPFDSCVRVYTTLHHLKVHERTHTGDKPFVCEYAGCDKSFATAYGLKSHSRVHTGEKPYKCPMEECTKAFKTSGDLQKHVRTHTGEKPFKCPFEGCEKCFTTSNIRKVHIRVHTGERPYECPMEGCNKTFSSATNYKNHVRIHTGERPYVCTVQGCGKRFTEYSSLYKHHIVHTHNKPYVCGHCGKTYRQTSTLAMHKRTAHNDETGSVDRAELVINNPAVFSVSGGEVISQNEDSEGALVINTQPDHTQEPEKPAVSTAVPRSHIQITSVAYPQTSAVTKSASLATAVTMAAASAPGPVVVTPGAGVTAVNVSKEGLLLPPELQGQRVFVITEPAQLQILQHLAASQQIQIISKSEVEPGS